ncbi:VCBS repeat-containing protein [Aureibaculum sp. 2210JD6-5]|uniref:VCBS repeat-containing protein n=1 Tax=Aureibaculum sp. 2210JD6-5 TaxID=3103957 RepID=UPI002AAEB029|nr:VCBS repeat-containing protein [Aureibaculum sp. 2210JD6-5]MDY7394303.1 VCBS repeat-containing protein [Aureibaculum sp. 2210JD6-5]
MTHIYKITISCLFIILLVGCKKNQNNSNVFESDSEKRNTLFSLVSTDDSDLIFENTVTQTRENNHMINSQFISGGGVAVGDINNDGLDDIYFTGNQVRDKLFLNNGNLKFEDISDKAGITKDNNWSTGVTFVDIDNDGDQDIYVCRFTYLENEKSPNQLYINNGDERFTEQATTFGLDDKGFSIQATFFDFDNDGLLDVYIVNQPPSIPNIGDKLNINQFSDIVFSDRLYKNLGNGKFFDYTEKANLRNFGFGLSATTGDFNNDGWQDIYVSNDFDVADHIYINQQDGTFKDEVHKAAKHISNFSMGNDIADYDNDGNLDVMVVDMVAEDNKRIKTNMSGMNPEQFWAIVNKGGHYQYMFNTLQRNNGNGTFSELGQLAGVTSTDWSWAPLLADFDNDGFKDLFVTNGVVSNNRYSDLTTKYDKRVDSLNRVAQQKGINPNSLIDVMDFVHMAPTDKLPNYIFKNNGDLTFSNKVKDWGMDAATLSNGAAYADFDLDGDLDLVVNNINEMASLYKNTTTEKKLGNYIRFKFDSDKNDPIYGTKITLYKNDSLLQIAQLTNSRGFMSKSEDVIHFGIGNKDKIDKAVIQWNDGTVSTLSNLEINKLHELKLSALEKETIAKTTEKPAYFRDVAQLLNLSQVVHVENEYDDYAHEVLLPHKMSQFGPSIAVGDVNGDKKEDFFLGGAAGFSGKLYLQNSNGTFDEITDGAWSQDKASEDMGIALIDVDNDKDLDLFVVSGGNEFSEGDINLQDRLYINNGKGKFAKSNGLPKYLTSGSCVLPFDYDKDGDLDLFVGGRLTPQKYPHATDSHLLENVGGKFIDATDKKAPEMKNLGMVTAASWTDYNNDGLQDLIVVGEWMPVTMFLQSEKGTFKKETIPNSEGWYYEVKTADMDNDGDSDIIVGNLGLNYKYKANEKEPFEVYSYDFDSNGSLDIVLSYYEHGVAFPLRGKSCSTQQIPSLKEKFPTYEEFGSSNLENIYGNSLAEALNLKAKTFASSYIENNGKGNYSLKPLPSLAQVSSVNSILIDDFDSDGHKDLLISGNLFVSEIETPRNDASIGLLLTGDGKGNFLPIPTTKSGFYAPYDAKDMKTIKVGNKSVILVANNNNFLQAIEFIKSKPKKDKKIALLK